MIDYKQNSFDWTLFRTDVRRDVMCCALLLFLFYAINLTVSVIVTFATSFKGIFELASSGEDFTLEQVMQEGFDPAMVTVISIIGIVAGSMAFLIRRKKRFFTDIALPMTEPLYPSIFIILVVVTQGIQFATGAISSFVDYVLPDDFSIVGNYESTVELLFTPVGMIYVVLVGPIFEELIFRGAILGPLRKYGDNFAILFSSLLFGLYHGVVLQIPFAFVMGLVLGYACCRWSLRTSIALHIISNGIAMLLSIEALAAVGGMFLLFCGIVTLILFFVFRTRLVARIRAGVPYYGRVTYTNGFSSIAFWLFAIAMVGFAILQLTGIISL